jgi:hypothetical protein
LQTGSICAVLSEDITCSASLVGWNSMGFEGGRRLFGTMRNRSKSDKKEQVVFIDSRVLQRSE